MMNTYELRGVSRAFRQGATRLAAVDGIDLTLEAGEFVVIQGRSGSGKSTLLQLMAGLDRPDRGQVLFEGRDLARLSDSELTKLRRLAFGFIFQSFNLIPTLTAAENVESALAPTGMRRGRRREVVARRLEDVGLADRAGHLPTQLSGGEQQRVAIARALANEPRIVLADEPTGNLDSKTSAEVAGLLKRLATERNLTILLVTHDSAISAQASRRLEMADGRLASAPAEGLEAARRSA